MERRVALCALAAAMLLPAAAGAQNLYVDTESVWGPKLRVTPFVGWAPGLTRTENWTVFTDQAVASEAIDNVLDPGLATGLTAEYRVWERFSVIGGGVYITRGDTESYISTEPVGFLQEGSNFLFLKLGAAMALREPTSDLQLRPLRASIFIAPTYMREMPREDLFVDEIFLNPTNSFGINFGFDGEMIVNDRLSVQAALEDYVTGWDDDELGLRADAYYAQNGFTTATIVDSGTSHQWLIRLGLGVTLR